MKKPTKKEKTTKKVPYHKQPEHLELKQWQTYLRRQFAETQPFEISKLDSYLIFSDYNVFNPNSNTHYKVALRSKDQENNFCSCMDFKTNRLGTCKHIEFVWHELQKKSDFDKKTKRIPKRQYSSLTLKYHDTRFLQLRIGETNKEAIQQLAFGYFDEDGLLKNDAILHIEKFLDKVWQLDTEFRCYPDALDYIIQNREDERRQNKIGGILSKQLFDKVLKVKLFPYQEEGILFAAKAGRCLIADEMGLGKTIQAIGASEILKEEFGIGKVLVVCPTSLKYQWKTEINKFTHNEATIIEGVQTKREKMYLETNSFFTVTSYHALLRDWQAINKAKFDVLILDEAQRIKNWEAKISQATKKIKTEYAFVLTGTPLENKLEELYSIMQTIDPYRLGPLYHFLHSYIVKGENNQIVGYKNLADIKKRLEGRFIRRTKAEVLTQLPQRMDKNLFVPMTPQQTSIHSEYGDEVAKLVAKWNRLGFLHEKDRQKLLTFLNMMRMVCDSTFIIDQKSRHDTKVDELFSILEEALVDGETKVVVFSQWERMLRLVAEELDAKEIPFEFLHGGVPSEKRGEMIERFNTSQECQIFLSTDAGGVGLNLQSASLLINMDIPWNPAVLEQRIGRIYRLGQKRNVQIINLVSIGTIENKMLYTLKKKSAMSLGVFDGGEENILFDSNKFRKFMEAVENITDQQEVIDDFVLQEPVSESEYEEVVGITESTLAIEDEIVEDEIPTESSDVSKEIQVPHKESQTPNHNSASGNPLAQILQAFSQPAKLQQAVKSMVEKDEHSGKTYLKIPVESEQAVEQILTGVNALAGFLQKLMG